MIVSRTPYRISFFGGGTDYPAWYREHGGAVLSTSIDKYCYVTCRRLPPFFDFQHRIVWSRIELVKKTSELAHPTVRSVLDFLDVRQGVEVHHVGDLPARTGIGSSSAFTVGLLHAIHALYGRMPTKKQLALEAIHVEQDLNRENVGSQDQAAAAFGGFNHIVFGGEGHFQVRPITLPVERTRALADRLMLFFTGVSRTSSEVAEEQVKNTPKRGKELAQMAGLVDQAIEVLRSGQDLQEFGRLLHEGWRVKRSLSGRISNPQVDGIYEAGISAGAVGGKLIGAGGGGFMLFFAPPEKRAAIRKKLSNLLHVPFHFEDTGSQVVFYKPDLEENYA